MVVVERCSLWRGGRSVDMVVVEVVVVDRWSFWRSDRCVEIVVVERWSLWRGGRCRENAFVERWTLWRGGLFGLHINHWKFRIDKLHAVYICKSS